MHNPLILMKRLPSICLLLLAACSVKPVTPPSEVDVCLLPPSVPTRADAPDENGIADYQFFVFNGLGMLETCAYVDARTLQAGPVLHRSRLYPDVPYTVLAVANLGYELPCRTWEEAMACRYHLAYPDEFSHGLPMAARAEGVLVKDGRLDIQLERLVARVDLTVDRRELDPDVDIRFVEVRVGGCPSSVLLFSDSRALSSDDLFHTGYLKSGTALWPLNSERQVGLSGTVSLYLLENRQPSDASGRFLEVCSYIELQASFHSPDWHTAPGETLAYRFWLPGESASHDVRRNCVYPLTLTLKGAGR